MKPSGKYDAENMPTGEICGDYKPMPDRGTGTGYTGFATGSDNVGGDTTTDAVNSMGSIVGSCGSDPMDKGFPG